MKIIIDSDEGTLTIGVGKRARTPELYTVEAFKILSDQWLKVGWNQRYSYTFSWMGRPIIQLPEDMIRETLGRSSALFEGLWQGWRMMCRGGR